MVLGIFTAVPFAVQAEAAEVTDTLTASDFTATNTTYKEFSGVKKNTAVYAGQSAKDGSGNIQLRSKSSNSGIVSTTSGGKVKSVKITVASGSNTVDIYGSNTAYTSAADLYGSSTQGTKVGSVTSTGTITFTDDYEYVGIRSYNGAIYLSSVEITWTTDGGDDPQPATEPTTAEPATEPTTAEPTEVTEPTEATEVTTEPAEETGVTDVLTYTLIDVSGTSYSNWSNKSVANGSGAVYAGNSAGGNTSIQLNSSSPKGIVTTTSGGKAKKVVVTWNSGTADGRTLDIYGKNFAYSAAADLYKSANQGTKLGSIVCGTSTELTIDGDYEYIGLRSNSGAMYLDEIKITWSNETEPTEATTEPTTEEPTTEEPTEPSDETNDVLNSDLTGITVNQYSDWSGSCENGSGAVYSGHSAGNYSSIQLRTSDSQAGIVTTTSGGKVAKVKVTWNDNTSNGQTLQIYGKNTAYSGPADLYDSDTSGTLLGTITKGTNQSTEFIVDSGTYTYIGLRSASGAMYLTDITITWVPLNAYNVTFKDGETVLDSHDVNINDIPVYSGETDPAAKPADAQYTYTFLGWTDGTTDYNVSDTLPAVTNDNVVYYARYDKTVNKYTVTWQNDEGVTLYQDDVDYGDIPVYIGETPTKTDDDYDYTFAGWKSSLDDEVYYYNYEIPPVTQAVTYTAQFTATPKPFCTVTWKNWDGSTIKTDTKVTPNTTAAYNGATPARTATGNYSYEFIGWATGTNNSTRYYNGMELPVVTSDIEFTALYEATPNYKSGRIVSTQDSSITYNVGGKCYLQDGELKTFSADASFSDNYVNDGTITLGDAVFTVTEPYPASSATAKKPTVSEFTHTLYVTGEGTQDDPFVFYPNFKYSAPNAENVNESNDLDKTEMHPGDILVGMARLRVGYDLVRFLQYVDQPDYDCQHGTKGFMGVSKEKYGYRYETTEAIPYSFVYDNKQLYYLGELGGAQNFSEKITYDTELGSVTPIYTVTWKNYDGSLIDTNLVYQGMSPVYSTVEGAAPTRPDDDYTYTFKGWKNAETEVTYGKDETLPVMSGDVTYIADFDAELIPTYTITWKNYDGTTLETDEKVKVGTTPSFDGDTPAREKTEQYIYFFSGWDDGEKTYTEFDVLPAASKDVIYMATFDECSQAGYEPIEDIEWVFKTNDNVAYDLEHMYYTYNGSDPQLFDGWSMFKRNGDTLLLGGKAVADIGVELNEQNAGKAEYWHADFVNSVYVTGDGSYYHPFEFHPNYLFYSDHHSINQGYHVTLKEEYHVSQNTNNLSYPGDQYKGNSLVAVGGKIDDEPYIQDVYYISKDKTEVGGSTGSSWYVGIGPKSYGKNYSHDEDQYDFEEGHEILYYYGEVDSVFRFDEYEPTYQNSFGRPTTYTVNWLNDDSSVLVSAEYYYGETPEYSGETPQKSEQANKYTFSGWSPQIEVVTADADYTAQYTKKKLFAGHSLTLGGDIGVCFYLDVPVADLTVEDVQSGTHKVSVKFSWYNKNSEYKISAGDLDFDSQKNMFVAKCYVAAAEMAYNIHAVAYIDGAEYTDEYNDYSVRQYGLKIINSEAGTFGAKHEQLVDLAKKMLDYGAKSQVMFNRTKNTDGTSIPFANADVEYTMQEYTIDRAKPDMIHDLSDAGLTFAGTSVVFLSKTTLRMYYKVTDADKFNSLPNRDAFVQNGSYYYLQVQNIDAYSLNDAQTFAINGVEYYYSVLDYAVLLQSGTQTEKDLGTALYWYNQAAVSYFK